MEDGGVETLLLVKFLIKLRDVGVLAVSIVDLILLVEFCNLVKLLLLTFLTVV